MFRNCALLVGMIAMFSAVPAMANQDRTTIGISITIVDPADAPAVNFIPQAPVATPVGAYAAQPVACNLRYNLCINPQGQPLGSIDEVRRTLPLVRPQDVQNRTVVCDRVCYDSSGRIVGASATQSP